MPEDYREVILCGVNMPATADTFKVPKMPGWRFVTATLQPFGAACIFEKEPTMLEFKDSVPLSNRLDIVASRIRQVEADIRRLLGQRASIDRTLNQHEDDLLDLKAQNQALITDADELLEIYYNLMDCI